MKVSLLAVLWILTVAFGYLLGLRDRPDPVALPALTQQSSKISLNNPVEVMGTKKKKSVDPTVEVKRIELVEEAASEPKSDFPRVIEEVSDTFEKMRSNNPLIRLQAFSELLQKNDEDSIRQAIAAYEELPEGSSRFSELRMLAYSWAQIDPIGAVEWMNELDGLEKRIGMGTVLDSWARTDSETAIAWAKENFDGEEGQENPYLIGIVSGMSQNDLVGATELMTSMPYGRARGRSASIIFEQTWKKGEEVAMNWAENLPEGSLQSFAYGEIGKKIAKEDMGRAVKWVDGMKESNLKAAVSDEVAERWARESPVEAAKWVASMPEGESRSESMEEVVSQWARKDPTATAEWLNQFPSGELMDEPIQRFVREVVRKDPEIAMTWAEAIVDQERRNRTVTEVNRVAERMAEQAKINANAEPAQSGNSGGGGGQRRGPSGSQPR